MLYWILVLSFAKNRTVFFLFFFLSVYLENSGYKSSWCFPFSKEIANIFSFPFSFPVLHNTNKNDSWRMVGRCQKHNLIGSPLSPAFLHWPEEKDHRISTIVLFQSNFVSCNWCSIFTLYIEYSHSKRLHSSTLKSPN